MVVIGSVFLKGTFVFKNYKIIIANPKKYIVSNIKKKNPELNMFNFNINELFTKNTNSFLK